jgi:long-chain acyl-CoA synthetase
VRVKISADKEILISGPLVMNGYWNDPRSTAEAIDEDGWLHTGDLGHLDQEGYLTIIGRKKEMIVTAGGKNVWPEQIENRLNATKYVLQSMVVGDKRKHLTALVVPDWSTLKEFLVENNIRTNERKAVQHPAVQQFYRQQIDQVTEELADYEKIVKFCLVIKEFSQEREELTPTLKLRRSMIATHYQKEIEQMYQA